MRRLRVMGAEDQQVGLQTSHQSENLLDRMAAAHQQLDLLGLAGGQCRRQAGPGRLGIASGGQHVHQTQPRSQLPGQQIGALQGQICLGAEVVGDEDVLNHGSLTRRNEGRSMPRAARAVRRFRGHAGVARPAAVAGGGRRSAARLRHRP
ncbi:hypothetical protein D3C78_1481010 [compost metagenome]